MQWRYISGMEGRYEVSETGKVRNSVTGRELKPGKCSNGYLRIALGRTSPNNLVHRLVAKAFCPGFVSGLDVNHKNGVRTDNRAANLEWVTRSGNIDHSYQVLGRKPHSLAVPIAVKGEGFLMLFPHQSALAKLLGVNPGSVASAMSKNHKVKGCEVAYV
jgi:hypothetical protein